MADMFIVALYRNGSIAETHLFSDQNNATLCVNTLHQINHMYTTGNDYIVLDQATPDAFTTDITEKATRLLTRPLSAPIMGPGAEQYGLEEEGELYSFTQDPSPEVANGPTPVTNGNDGAAVYRNTPGPDAYGSGLLVTQNGGPWDTGGQ